MPLYPLFLKIADQPCLVVGAGDIGAQKAEGLLTAGAKLTVVAPDVGPRMERAIAEAPSAVVVRREFVASDCEGQCVVISATGDASVDGEVYAAAKAERALVNVVDVKERCDFYAGSIVQQGPLAVLIGTEGKAPAVARYTRQLLERELPPSLGVLAEALGARRPRLLDAMPDFVARGKILGAFVERAAPRLRPSSSVAEVEAWIDAELLAPPTDDNPTILRIEVDFTAAEGKGLATTTLASKHFSEGVVDVEVLGTGDVAYVVDCVRNLLRPHVSLDGVKSATVLAHGVEVSRSKVTTLVEDNDAATRAKIVDAIAPLATIA